MSFMGAFDMESCKCLFRGYKWFASSSFLLGMVYGVCLASLVMAIIGLDDGCDRWVAST